MMAELLLCMGIAQAASWVGMSYSLAWQLEVADAEEVVEVVVTDMVMMI
jgi:molybdenum-dependent DNA-binding transcriptional regulator ModE